MFQIRNVIDDLNLLCFCISTDCDNGIDHYHIQIFESFEKLIDEKNEVIAIPKSAHPIIDIYHVLKPQRARFFRQNLALSPNSPVFKQTQIQKLVNRGPCFSTTNDVIRFKDEYAIDFFSPLSFLDVITNVKIIPFSYYLWQCSTRYKNHSISQQLYFLNLAFLIFKFEYDNFHECDSEFHFYEENVNGYQILSFYSKNCLINYMSTLIENIYIIKNFLIH